MAFIDGFLIGLSFVVFVGPVFFTLLQSTLSNGRLAGLMVAIGILVSDVVAVAICLLGANVIFQDKTNNYYIGIAAAVLLFLLGAKYILRPGKATIKLQNNTIGLAGYFAKGFLVNFVNPFVIAVWLGVITYADTKYGMGTDLYIFLSAALLAIIFTDSTKVLLANKLKFFLDDDKLKVVYRVIGVALVGFGVSILYRIM